MFACLRARGRGCGQHATGSGRGPGINEIGPNDIVLDECDVPVTLTEELDRSERRRIEEALRNANGSRTHAAKALGIPRTTLLNKMKRYGLA